MRHWITSFQLLTMIRNVRGSGPFDKVAIRPDWLGSASLPGCGGRIVRACAALALAALAAAFALFGAPASAQPAAKQEVDLELVLAVDVSGSVNHERFLLQRDGYVAAFRHPQVLSAIRSGPNGAIAVTMVQWTGPRLQEIAVPWTRVSDAGTAEDFAGAIERAPRVLFGGGTSISGAIDHGVGMFAQSPFKGLRRVIDVSGDGINNRGRPTVFARDEAVAAGIVINGLPILALEPGLDYYYRQSVIGGPGSFVIAAENYETFGEAVRRKLILEIAQHTPPPALRQGTKAPPARLIRHEPDHARPRH